MTMKPIDVTVQFRLLLYTNVQDVEDPYPRGFLTEHVLTGLRQFVQTNARVELAEAAIRVFLLGFS
jgi:hypothetical protein